MADYYFLATLLTPLKVGSPPEISSQELDFILRESLTKNDYELVQAIYRLKDIENIRQYLLGYPLFTGGTIDILDLPARVDLKIDLPHYALQFLEEHTQLSDRLEHYPELLRTYFEKEKRPGQHFLNEYLDFECKWRLIFVVLRAKELNRDIEYEIRFEDPQDPFIEEILLQKDTKSFDPPESFRGLRALFESRKHAPYDLYKAVNEWRFEKVQEMIDWQFFSIERILGYVIQLQICEEWLQLNKEKGLERLDEMEKI